MVYLEYDIQSKQVVEIHEEEPKVVENYDFAITDNFIVGEEFEQTIWINEVDENKNLTSFSAIRNNPNARRLLQENEALKTAQAETNTMLLDFMESMIIL